AQAILLQLREDLTAAIAPHRTPVRGLGDVEARLWCEPPPTRLFLVRAPTGESEHPITGHAGSTIAADAVIDMRDDLEEAREARLRATGGALEVAWVLEPDGVLYRGYRAPIGSPGSLFDVGGYELARPVGPALAAGADADGDAGPPPAPRPAPAADADAGPLPALLRPFATGVAHLELLFWTQYTNTWSTESPPLRGAGPDEASGPLPYWDSTRAVQPPTELRAREFTTFVAEASL